jgi:hypothetical protein
MSVRSADCVQHVRVPRRLRCDGINGMVRSSLLVQAFPRAPCLAIAVQPGIKALPFCHYTYQTWRGGMPSAYVDQVGKV